jgi:hypothetical protein
MMIDADGSLYDEDFYARTQQQAELLRRGPAASNRWDYDLLAEGIEDLGESELHACQSLCEHIIERLPKIEYSGLPKPANDLCYQIVEWRIDLERRLTRSVIAKLDLPDRYRVVLKLLRYLERDMPGLITQAPAECPYSLDQIPGGIGGGAEDWFPTPRPP